MEMKRTKSKSGNLRPALCSSDIWERIEVGQKVPRRVLFDVCESESEDFLLCSRSLPLGAWIEHEWTPGQWNNFKQKLFFNILGQAAVGLKLIQSGPKVGPTGPHTSYTCFIALVPGQ